MSVSLALGSAIYSKLTGSSNLTGLLAGTGAVYRMQAPEAAALPFVVFGLQAGGPENITASDLRDEVYNVQAYARTPALAGSIDAQVSSLLHHGSLTVSGYTNIWCGRETDLEYTESEPTGAIIYHAGALYRIRLTD